MNATPPVIRVTACRKTYGAILAMDDVSFDVVDGEIFGLIGPNGAGKTTTLETKIFLREPMGAIGTIAIPVLAFIAFGRIARRALPPRRSAASACCASGCRCRRRFSSRSARRFRS